MKNFIKQISIQSLVTSSVFFTACASWAQTPISGTNVSSIYEVGTTNPNSNIMTLHDGLYEMGALARGDKDESQYMLVQTDSNDETRFFAIMFPKRLTHGTGSGTAYLYHGRSIQQGASLMLAPISIDASGNLSYDSERQTKAPVLEINLRPGRFEYPFVVKGRNGALEGKIKGLKALSQERPFLQSRPTNGVFVSGKDQPNVVITYPQISIYEGRVSDNTYTMLEMNGDVGQFSALTRSELDTMAEANLFSEEIKSLAIFAQAGCFGSKKEVMFHLKPTVVPGAYRVDVFHPAAPYLWERIFPGQTIPGKK